MRREQFESFREPSTGLPLTLIDAVEQDGRVKTGKLVNAGGEVIAKIEGFTPSFTPDDNYAANFGLQWGRHAKTQLDSHTGATLSRDRLHRTAGWSEPMDLRGKRILEAGSGAGRFTEVLADTGAAVYSFDYSQAVHANFDNNGRRDNVAIFRGDIYQIPFTPRSFDVVVCLGVLQHTPDVAKSFRELARMVKPGGLLVIDVYAGNWRQCLHWKYVLRPITTRMNPQTLYRFCQWYAPKLAPMARGLYRIAKPLRRLVPVMDQSDRALCAQQRLEWTILDTYDALAARYDQPQSARTIGQWFTQAGMIDVTVTDGTVVTAHGRAPA